MREPLTTHTGRAVGLPIANIDTDQLIPARFMSTPREEGYARFLLHDMRRGEGGDLREDFPLNQPAARGADTLVTADNLGCGSSREAAVYALADSGFRVLIAPSFGDIFYANALKNGVLPIRLPEAVVTTLLDRLARAPGQTVTVDVPDQTVRLPGGAVHRFEIDGFRKAMLVAGQDELSLTLSLEADISAFEAANRPRPDGAVRR